MMDGIWGGLNRPILFLCLVLAFFAPRHRERRTIALLPSVSRTTAACQNIVAVRLLGAFLAQAQSTLRAHACTSASRATKRR